MTVKKIALLFLTLCALLFVFPASAADTQEEWDASCNWVIASDTKLYTASYKGDGETVLYEFTPVGAIAAGKRVKVRSSYGEMRQISYWLGGQRTAWIRAEDVSWSNAAASAPKKISTYYGSAAVATKYDGKWKDLEVYLQAANGAEKDVFIVTLGSAQCLIHDGETEKLVPTADLVWPTEAPEDKQLAVIYAPRTGKATLRASDSTKARSRGQCKAGRLVVVLVPGETFTQIMYDGKEGYILTSALQFIPIAGKDEAPVKTLVYQERTDSSATISLYTDAKAKRKIDQFRVGNEVSTFGENGKWTEVEIDGWRGFLKTEYLQ